MTELNLDTLKSITGAGAKASTQKTSTSRTARTTANILRLVA